MTRSRKSGQRMIDLAQHVSELQPLLALLEVLKQKIKIFLSYSQEQAPIQHSMTEQVCSPYFVYQLKIKYNILLWQYIVQQSGGPGFKPRWRCHCGIQAVSFGKAPLSSQVRRMGTLTWCSRASEPILWARLKNHRNLKVDFLCILPLSLGWPNITISCRVTVKTNSITILIFTSKFRELWSPASEFY